MYESPAPSRATIERFKPVPGLHGIFVLFVSVVLSVAGGAVGLFIGAFPYFLVGPSHYARVDLFFAQSMIVGAMVGLIVGCANGTRWFHENDIPGWLQRRLIRYMRGVSQVGSGAMNQRTISVSYLQQLRSMQGDLPAKG